MLDLSVLLILSEKATNLHANKVLMYKHLEIGSNKVSEYFALTGLINFP